MRLFWKLFIALLLSLSAIAAVSSWFSQHWLLQTQQTEHRLNLLAGYADTAANLYVEEGPDAMRRWLRRNMQQQYFRGFLLDKEGHILLPSNQSNRHGRQLPPGIAPLIEQAVKSNQTVKLVRPPHLLVVVPVTTAQGAFFWLANSIIPPDAMQQNRQISLAFQLLVALGLVLLVSWLISRMFTQPIRQLQQSAARLGSGIMQTRAPETLTSRGDELGALAHSFDAMAAQLENLMGSHKQLLRDVSHELRSPLARLTVALELARDTAGEAAQEDLTRIGLEAERLNELIGEVLSLARFEQGAIRPEMNELDLSALLADVATDAKFEADASGKHVQTNIAGGVHIQGDCLWFQRALDNVLRNAVRHTASQTAVEVSMGLHGKRVKISIRDHGPGVPDEALEKIFEPFYRAEEARTRSGGGYGLGLAIARRVVEMHGGQIIASHAPGGGLQIDIAFSEK